MKIFRFILLVLLNFSVLGALVAQEEGYVRIYLPSSLHCNKNIGTLLDSLDELGYEIEVCDKTGREYILVAEDTFAVRANSGQELWMRGNDDILEWPHLFSSSITPENIVGSYWALGHNRAVEMAAYENGCLNETAEITGYRYRLSEINGISSTNGEWMIDPFVLGRGEMCPPSIVLIDDKQRLLHSEPSSNCDPPYMGHRNIRENICPNFSFPQSSKEFRQLMKQSLEGSRSAGAMGTPTCIVNSYVPPSVTYRNCSIPVAPHVNSGIMVNQGTGSNTFVNKKPGVVVGPATGNAIKAECELLIGGHRVGKPNCQVSKIVSSRNSIRTGGRCGKGGAILNQVCNTVGEPLAERYLYTESILEQRRRQAEELARAKEQGFLSYIFWTTIEMVGSCPPGY